MTGRAAADDHGSSGGPAGASERDEVWDTTPDPVDDGIPLGAPPPPGDDEASDAFGGEVGGGDAVVEPEVFPEPDIAAQRDEYLDALQRLQADFENYRKRVQRQHDEQASRAASDIVTKLLPVLDTLDLARAHFGVGAAASGGSTEETAGEEARALEQARAQLLDVLAREGLERLDEAAVPFDPSVHDAVAHADDGDEEGAAGEVVVDEVLRAGYRWRGQVLRPAMVRVRG